jgi:hypothetical protein
VRRIAILIGAVGALVVGGVAVGATGGFSVGSEIHPGEPEGPSRNELGVTETVLATGESPVGGSWRLTSFGSPGLEADGETLEERGSPCIRPMLDDPPENTPQGGSGFCVQDLDSKFTMASLPVTDGTGRAGHILFGTAPEHSHAVVFRAENAASVRNSTSGGPASFAGDVWALPVPLGGSDPTVTWYRESGGVGGTRDASGYVDRLPR